MKQFLLNAALGIGILLVCVAFGYFVIGPRMEFTPEGKPRFNLGVKRSDGAGSEPQRVELPPKVDVYEKLPPSITSGAGDAYRAVRQIAPGDLNTEVSDKPKRSSGQSPRSPGSNVKPLDKPAPENEELSIETPVPNTDTIDSSLDEQETPAAPASSPKPEKEQEKPAEPTKSNTVYYRVQVGIYQNRENANQVVQTLRGSGFPAAVVPFQRDGSTVYRVQVGVFSNKETADAVAKSVRDKGFEVYVSGGN